MHVNLHENILWSAYFIKAWAQHDCVSLHHANAVCLRPLLQALHTFASSICSLRPACTKASLRPRHYCMELPCKHCKDGTEIGASYTRYVVLMLQVWQRSCCGSSVAAHLLRSYKTRTFTSGMAMAHESTWTASASLTGKQAATQCVHNAYKSNALLP